MKILCTGVLLLVLFTVCSTTVDTKKLFRKTLRRWNIEILGRKDRRQRWERFQEARNSVDRTNGEQAEKLGTLNHFSVLNDTEFLELMAGFANFNITLNKYSFVNVDESNETLPEEYEYWEKDVGLTTPKNQHSCGSCWSFPTTASLEALYRDQTGEAINFSEQFLIDCTFDGDGCGGGGVSDGFRSIQDRQYLLSTETWPYTAEYKQCTFGDDIASGQNNALKKLWLTSIIPLSTNEESFLRGLLTSPVAFGSIVSTDLVFYSGGLWEDTNCEGSGSSHAMLLVGYTETYLRVRGSYGADWGDNGYANYARGAHSLAACSFYKTAFAIKTTYRRELEYEFCGNKKLVTRNDCKASCEGMNTEGETGWTMAVIPTKYHSALLLDMINSLFPGEKNDDKFNVLWIGLSDLEKTGELEWADGYTPVQYMNVTENVGKYGLINKMTGVISFKNSLTYKARGVCSRAATCWDIGTAVPNGVVTFDDATRTEGTVASVTCDEGFVVEGADSLICEGGLWSEDLPTCVPEPTPEPSITIRALESSLNCTLGQKRCHLYFEIISEVEIDPSKARVCKLNKNNEIATCGYVRYKSETGLYRKWFAAKQTAGSGNYVCTYGDVVSDVVTVTIQ